jgi:hypothetical protein
LAIGCALVVTGSSQASVLPGLAARSAEPGRGLPAASVGTPPFLVPPGPVLTGNMPTLPPALVRSGPTAFGSGAVGAYAIPAIVLDAYQRAAVAANVTYPSCHLDRALLAAIGQVESGHAHNGNVLPNGDLLAPIYGPALNGANGTALISGGWARAMGPMQFIPSSWSAWGVDGNGDGKADPQNVYDATLAAAHYLCAGRDLSTWPGMTDAVYSYNHSSHYVDVVMSWFLAYRQGVSAVPGQLAAFVATNDGPATSTDSARQVTAAAATGPKAPAPTPSSPPVAGGGPTPTPLPPAPTPAPSPTPNPPGSGLLPAPVAGLLPAPVINLLAPVVALLPGPLGQLLPPPTH